MLRSFSMQAYQVKTNKLSGTSYAEIERAARSIYKRIAAQTKRNPYIRSVYFQKEKIFLKLFWEHLNQKRRSDRKRRLKFYACALELLRSTTCEPQSKPNVDVSGEILHRFMGITKEGEIFYVQVKQGKRKGDKHFISVFPPN